MLNSKRIVEGIIGKLKNILLEEDDLDMEPEEAPNSQEAIPAAQISANSKHKANQYGDKLSATDKIKANNIVKNTLLKGAAGAVDATFIDDLDTRFTNNQRTSLDTPKTLSYDYILHMLVHLYQAADGEVVDVGGQTFPLTANMKRNVYEGLLKMFDLQDRANRWKWFIFGSNIPGVSLVKPIYRPKISLKRDGTYDFEEVDHYIEYLNFWLKNGQLIHMLNRMMGNPKDNHNAFAYVITALRNKYISLKRYEGSAKRQSADYDAYTDPNYQANLTDPRALGAKKDLGGKIDTTMDLRNLGAKDRGEDPAHHTLQRFVNALKVDIEGNDGMEDSERESMAKTIGAQLLAYVENKFTNMPKMEWLPDVFKAKLSGNPPSLNHISRPEYQQMYPTAYAAFHGKPVNYPMVYFRNAYKKYIKPEADRLEKQYIDQMDLDMRPQGAHDDWQEKGDKDKGEEKLSYGDYANPLTMTKRTNALTGEPETYSSYDDLWQSLEEGGDKKGDLAAAVSSAVDNFFLND